MTKTLLLTLFAAFFLIGGIPQSYACPGQDKCKCAHSEASKPCEKCMEAGKTCKCGKGAKKPCEMKMDGKKPCMKCAGKDHDANIRTGDEVHSNIGSLKMESGIQKDSYND